MSADKGEMSISLEHSESVCTLRISGEVNIDSATDLKDLLLEGLATGKALRTNLRDATHLDITAMQLLWAVERAFSVPGKKFSVDGPIPNGIALAFAEAGFETFPVSSQ
jgi:ABC-type transporter Mla MlaB component